MKPRLVPIYCDRARARDWPRRGEMSRWSRRRIGRVYAEVRGERGHAICLGCGRIVRVAGEPVRTHGRGAAT